MSKLTETHWTALDSILDKIAEHAANNDGVINHNTFSRQIQNTEVYRKLKGTEDYDIFLNAYTNGLDYRLEKLGFDPHKTDAKPPVVAPKKPTFRPWVVVPIHYTISK